MKNAFIDANTGVLKAFGYVDANQEGDIKIPVDDDFDYEPGSYAYIDSQWAEAANSVRVPQVVTMRQARLALRQAGLLTTVNEQIAAMTGDAGDDARIEWDYSSEVLRHKGLVVAMAQALNLTEEQLDQLFITAATL
jgi:hypothetical protein